MKCSLVCLLLFFLSNANSQEKLSEIITLHGIVRPQILSIQVAIGQGIINKIYKNIGDKAKKNDLLVRVFEKNTIREYRATFNGQIAKIHQTESAAVSPGMALITMVDAQNKYLEFNLSPDQAKKIKKGSIVINSENQKNLAKINLVSPIVDPETGSVIANSNTFKEQILIGEVIKVEVNLGEVLCDKVVHLNEIGKNVQNTKVMFISKNKACLNNIK